MSEWWKPSKPEDLQAVPWISPAAIDFLAGILTPDMEVIEHGSGGSTLFMAERVSKVTAYEVDPDWQAIVKQKAPANVRIISRGTHNIRKAKQVDLLFIDGEPLKDRCEWLAYAEDFVKPGGWIVLDNANRPEYKAERDALADIADLIERVDANVQNRHVSTNFLVTEFWKVRSESRD